MIGPAMKKRWSHEAQGKVLRSENTGMVYVPYQQTKGGWYVVVVKADAKDVYRPGGYNLLVFDGDVEVDTELVLHDPDSGEEVE